MIIRLITIFAVQIISITLLSAQTTIYWRDGQYLEVYINKLKDEDVIFIPTSYHHKLLIRTCVIDRIEYEDGTVQRFATCPKDNEYPKVEADIRWPGLQFKADGQRITHPEAGIIFNKYSQDASILYKKGQKQTKIARGLGVLSTLFLISSFAPDFDPGVNIPLLVTSGVGFGATVAANNQAYTTKIKSTAIYNTNRSTGFNPPYQAPSYTLGFGATQNGVGFLVQF
jgi:hypothetical protein